MFGITGLGFAAPWVLGGLLLGAGLWWLLKMMPPRPRRLVFPSVLLLRRALDTEETPARVPWWLYLLRLALLIAVILGLAGPVFNPAAPIGGAGPMVLVIDNDWAAAPHWDARLAMLETLIDRAGRADRPVMLIPTARAPMSAPDTPLAVLGPMSAANARQKLGSIEPRPWPADHRGLGALLPDLSARAGSEGAMPVVWLTSGILGDSDPTTPPVDITSLATDLDRLGGLAVVQPTNEQAPLWLSPPANGERGMAVTAHRAVLAGERPVTARALAADGRVVAEGRGAFAAGDASLTLDLAMPIEARNEIARVELAPEVGAGRTWLLDNRWRRRTIALVGADADEQPLLTDTFYLGRALEEAAALTQTSLDRVLADTAPYSVVVMGDRGGLAAAGVAGLEQWIGQGGVLIRFAGSALATAPDALTPVPLRSADRRLGGALSWDEPARLAPFAATSPFAGITVPTDVTVERQVLARPSPQLAERTWARLEDGTPLVTAKPIGSGWLMLIHTTAEPSWSSLAISGLFVEMLRAMVALADGRADAGLPDQLNPIALMDGFGRVSAADGGSVRAVPPRPNPDGPIAVNPRTPPGYYGSPRSRVAVNMLPPVTDLRAWPRLPSRVDVGSYGASREIDLRPLFLTLALALAIIDFAVTLALRGLIPSLRREGWQAWRPGWGSWRGGPTSVLVLALTAAAAMPHSARAQALADDAAALAATLQTQLGYVLTGDRRIDETSRLGLDALAAELRARTALDDIGTVAVNPARDELAFYPLLYWPVTDEQATLREPTRRKLNAYMRFGGLVVFDTRDGGLTNGSPALHRLTQGLDIAPLTPLPSDHVLTKAFFLLEEFPGRLTGGQLWVEQGGASGGADGVSAVVLAANDYAAAWAVDDIGRPLNVLVPDGARQREWAYRFGINLVLYALAGNYKADQVHVPSILMRLGN